MTPPSWLPRPNSKCLALFLGMTGFWCSLAQAQVTADMVIFSVRLNGTAVSNGSILQKLPNGTLLVSKKDLAAWHLRQPVAQGYLIHRQRYYSLAELHITHYRINSENQSLSITAPARAFLTTTLSKSGAAQISVTPPVWGTFFNYDIYAQQANHTAQEGGYFKLGVFNPFGIATTSFIAQNNNALQNTPGQSALIRLNSTWISTYPNRMTRLKVGDFINQPGSWGNAVRMGGIQYGTNFSTQPYLVTTPLYSIRGQAALPSMVDVYVNHVLVAQHKVPSGPFALTNLPVITGGGNITTVVTNVLGAQQIITQPFFSNQQLLRTGLSDFSFSLGGIRQNYGIQSDNYGPVAAVGTYRIGLSNAFTGEIHGDVQANQGATLGLSGTWLIRSVGILSSALAYSRNPGIYSGQGMLASLAFQRITPALSFSASAQVDTAGFTQLGDAPGYPRLHWQGNATISHGFGHWGSLSASYITQKYFGQPDIKIAQANYNLGLGRWGYVSATLLRAFAPEQSMQVGLYWTVPLGSRSSASLSAQSDATSTGKTLFTATAQRNLPVGSGWGYMAQASSNQQAYLQGQYRGSIGTYTAQLQSFAGDGTSYRLEATGGVGYLAGNAFLSRTINDSFALIQVPQLAGVQVYANNNLIGKTNALGNLIVPQLQPYQHNMISINQGDLPMDADVSTLEMPLVPAYLSGSVLKFNIKVVRSATFTLLQENGKPVPSGAILRIRGQKKGYPVGYHGLSYLSGFSVHNVVNAQWDHQSCSFRITDIHTKSILPDLGVHVCRKGDMQQ